MDAIEGLDDGVYAHFTFQAGKFPQTVDFMEPAYHISSYVGVLVLLVLIVGLFLFQRQGRGAVVALLSFCAGYCLIETVRAWVPRARPQGAHFPLEGSSYPSAGVFLFMLGMILLGRALWDLLGTWGRTGYVVVAALLTVWVCVGEFFLAIHYLTDVIGGIAGATLIGWIACRLLEASPRENPAPARGQVRETASGL